MLDTAKNTTIFQRSHYQLSEVILKSSNLIFLDEKISRLYNILTIQQLLLNYLSHIYSKKHKKYKGNCILTKHENVIQVKAVNKVNMEKETTAIRKKLEFWQGYKKSTASTRSTLGTVVCHT